MIHVRFLSAAALCAALWFAAGLSAASVEVVAGGGSRSTPGPAVGAELIEPFAVAFDKAGNWYICEHKGQRIHRVTPEGAISVFAGTGERSFAGDGGPAAKAAFIDPHGIVIGPDQQMYVADTRSHTVRKIDLKKGSIETIAGDGTPGFSGDGGLAKEALFHGTYGIDLEPRKRLIYVADLDNLRVRRIDLRTGRVTTIAGNGEEGIPPDGAVAAEAPLLDPRAVAADALGNVYILERKGNALRRVDAAGKITTVIAPGELEVDMKGPKHLTVDFENKVIIADAENHLIRKYDPQTDKTVTIAGTGEPGDRVMKNDPLKTQLRRPHGVFVHPSGALYIVDSYNGRVLRITP